MGCSRGAILQAGQENLIISLFVFTDIPREIPPEVEAINRLLPCQIVLPSLEQSSSLPLLSLRRLAFFRTCHIGRWISWIRGVLGDSFLRESVALIDRVNNEGMRILEGSGPLGIIALPVPEKEMIQEMREMFSPHREPEVEQVKRRLLLKFGMDQFVGESIAFRKAIEKIELYSKHDGAVLITGETGTGKESIARAIHYLGKRSDKPFIPINCGAMPDHLVENELFGHTRGAYTDATRAERGLVSEAAGGTVFFDEVNTLSPSTQVKLLRFLEDRKYKPLGSSKYLDADVRLIFATNVDLYAETRYQRFREDFYHRINLLTIDMPPLRDRGEDVTILAMHFLKHYSRFYDKEEMHFSATALGAIFAHPWRGNVRELKNAIERVVIGSRSNIIDVEELGITIPELRMREAISSLKQTKHMEVREIEKEYLLRVLRENDGNISRAARIASKDRRSFQRLLRKHGIQAAAFR